MGLQNHVDDVEATFFITVGFVLFVIPEPATSALGIAMMLLGIVWWFDEWRSAEV
ncbi:hypothetical protein [Salinibaculum rarum]|uniref:hypothetical protein n=1 Tax=Salinibaculum rarum TaxID=3058903 RepID=UPI00265D8FD9|nr:hypothetical protein [Salinibaculum sp. KK48]